jgi:hypothetical protein
MIFLDSLVRCPYIVLKSTWPAPPARALKSHKGAPAMKKKAKKEDKKAPKKGK